MKKKSIMRYWIIGLLLGLVGLPSGSLADDIGLVRAGDEWRYFKGTSEASFPTDAWRQIGFDDSSWLTGHAAIGYGGEPPATELNDMQGNYVSVYMRRTFTIEDLDSIEWLVLRADYDDGFVAYINGVEVWRQGFALGPHVPFNALAPPHAGGSAEEFNISYAVQHLQAGTNVLAVQFHNEDINSPGCRMLPELLANFHRGPYVQDAKTDGMTIVWRTPYAADTVVYYGTSTNLGSTFSNSSPTTQHVAHLSGLNPASTYYYQISSSTDGVHTVDSSVYSFKTASVTGDIHFLVVGDSGNGSTAQYKIAEVMENQEVDFVIHVGDAVYPDFTAGLADIRCMSVYANQMAGVPYYVAVGNHDIEQYQSGGTCVQDESVFLDTFYLPTNSVTGTEHYYSFDYGDAHFVVLSSDKRLHSYAMGSAQYNWLEADLAATTKPWKFVILHHCPYTSSTHRGDDNDYFPNANCDWAGNGIPDRTEMKDTIGALAAQYGAQLMFFGHEHNYEKFNPVGGVHSVLSGGGGTRIRDINSDPNDIDETSSQFWARHSVAKVHVQGDTLSLDTLDDQGNSLDRLYIQRAAPSPQQWLSTWHSPVVETGTGPDDGNHPGQSFDFIGTPIGAKHGMFSNLGRVFVNNDATNLYIGLEQSMLYEGNNLFLFIDVSTLSGVNNMIGIGNGFLDSAGQGVDGLDILRNVSFTGFSPDIGCLLGDEYGDGQFRSFARPSSALFNIGQGIFRLDAGLSDIANIRLQQYNRSPQGAGVSYEQDANLIEVCIPFSSLGGLQPTGQVIKIAALAAGDGYNLGTQSRYMDTAFLGEAMSGFGEDPVNVTAVSVLLQSEGDDPDGDGLTNAEEVSAGTRPDIGDTDGDMLLDGWEVMWGINPLSATGNDGASGDGDGDGMTNFAEQMAGTDPTDPLSVFDAQSSSVAPGNGFVVSWPSISNRKYSVYQSGSVTGTFSSIVIDLPSTPPLNSYTDSVDGVQHRYYRIEVYP